jgi:hypothetical protein
MLPTAYVNLKGWNLNEAVCETQSTRSSLSTVLRLLESRSVLKLLVRYCNVNIDAVVRETFRETAVQYSCTATARVTSRRNL